tara:strand:- start:1567 stop:3045 length:1479 start_codon:yes stop_codon:yes gene_type:complete
MLNKDQKALLERLMSSASHEQKIWLAGYMQGQIGSSDLGASAPNSNKPNVMVYYATETGNSKGLSLQVMKAAKAAGYKIKNSAVNRLKAKDIKSDVLAIFLCSTHGEGDPPETAIKFYEEIKAAADGALEGLQYAVLGLGDSSYEIFCGFATDLDKELQRLGGKPFQENALFDVDYASHTPSWIEQTVKNMDELVGADSPDQSVSIAIADEQTVRTGKGYTRLEPIKGTIKEIVNLNDIDSNKETYHIEIEYDDDVIYTCGDAAGIIVPEDLNGGDPAPRLYSIASSPAYHEGKVHLTVALATHTNEDGSTGYGIYSKYLADLKTGDVIDFYIHQNQIFNLPADDTDIIMIGPGTGIAPFRSFIYERSERGSEGRNWLFFGDQHMHCDFLYQAEWQEHLATETLHKIDLAFSRDQEHKIYVQDRLRENAKDVIEWIDGGATLYLCGTKDPMSKDVDQALIDIIAEHKSLTAVAAEDFLADLEENDRYLKDVY